MICRSHWWVETRQFWECDQKPTYLLPIGRAITQEKKPSFQLSLYFYWLKINLMQNIKINIHGFQFIEIETGYVAKPNRTAINRVPLSGLLWRLLLHFMYLRYFLAPFDPRFYNIRWNLIKWTCECYLWTGKNVLHWIVIQNILTTDKLNRFMFHGPLDVYDCDLSLWNTFSCEGGVSTDG